MSSDRFKGVITPILTPYNDDMSIATDLYLTHAGDCLAAGSHYLSPFGTTGEALSNSARERMAVLEALITSGTARPDQLMPGTGLCSLEETLTLSRHAVDLGCAGVMTLPPFFYVGASDEGLYRYFSNLIEGVGSADLKICLYHIPQMSGMAVSPGLTARLNEAFPDTVVAYKDSSGNWDNTQAVIEAAPGVSVFPGSESFLLKGLALNGGGCISASCNSNVAAIRRLYEFGTLGDTAQAAALEPAINRHRKAIEAAGLIPALKSLKAFQSGDARWLNLRAPLEAADPAVGAALNETVTHI